jgi:glucose/arabinose dehydrogenase
MIRAMRKPAAVALAVAIVAIAGSACGSKKPAKDDGAIGSEPQPQPIDAGPTADATPLLPCTTSTGTTVSVHSIGKVNGSAVLATAPVNDGRLFVVEQNGRIRIFKDETLVPTPFLDISDNSNGPVVAGGEQGLLGLAFDPGYATNRYFYVDYTGNNPDTADTGNPWVDIVVRYQVSTTNPDVADPATATPILSIPDFATNHNGGMIEFGSDGYLYIGTGDGGAGGDPHRNGQNPNALLGKMLRIDVAHPANGKPYGIPSDNPFADGTAGAPEVFMLGLRNPWRWSFDRATGDMWIGDVGQGQIEELDVLKAGQQAGKNLGWSAYEASVCCAQQTDKCTQSGTQQACDATGKFFPQLTHSHSPDGWLAIIGGQVYRGTCYTDLVGTYFFTDNSKHTLSKATLHADGTVTALDLPGTWPQSPASIHADARGELYLTTTSGEVFHIQAGP